MTTFCSTFFTFIIFCANLELRMARTTSLSKTARVAQRLGAPERHGGLTGPVGFWSDVRDKKCPGATTQTVPGAIWFTQGDSHRISQIISPTHTLPKSHPGL